MRFYYPIILFALLQNFTVLPSLAQRSGNVDLRFNAADEGYSDLMAGTSEMQSSQYYSDWYSSQIERISYRKTVVVTDQKGAGAIFDSTGRIVLSFPNLSAERGHFVPYQQLADGTVLGTCLRMNASYPFLGFRRLTPGGQVVPGYDTSFLGPLGLSPLFAFADGRLLYTYSTSTGSDEILVMFQGNGIAKPGFFLSSTDLHGSLKNSAYFQVAPDRIALLAGRYLTLIDTSGGIMLNKQYVNPYGSSPITGKLVYATASTFYVQVTAGSASAVYRYLNTGRLDPAFTAVPVREGRVLMHNESRLIHAFADSLKVYDMTTRQWTVRRKMPQDATAELPISYDLENNAVIFPSLRILTAGSWGAASQSLYHVKPDNSLDLALQRRAGYGPYVGGVMQVNDSTLFLEGVWRANGILLPGKGVTVDRNTGIVRPVRFPFTQRVLGAADDDSYYLSDTAIYRPPSYPRLNAQAQPYTSFFLDSTQALIYYFFPRRGGGAYALSYANRNQVDFKPILTDGSPGPGPSYQILNESKLMHAYLQGLELTDGSWVLYRSLYANVRIPTQTHILVLKAGVISAITLPTAEFVKAAYALPNGGFAVTCHSEMLNWSHPRKSYYFNPDLTPNDALTNALSNLVLVGTQSDGGLLLCDDAQKTIYRHLPDGSPDPYWYPLPFEGSFVNFYAAPDDQLYAYGAFYRIGGVGRTNLAKIDSRLATRTSVSQKQPLTVYPSPASDCLQIRMPIEVQGLLRITDIAGQVRYQGPVAGGTSLSVQGWAAGVYQATLTGPGGHLHQARFIVR